jgi:hypothetical protein
MDMMNMPGFTAESALSMNGRGYRMPQLPQGERITAASAVQVALINNGGGGGSNFTCDDDGGCSCLGGSLSSDCWLMQQYCVTNLQCSEYFPYKCVCNWKLARPPQRPIFTRPRGGVFTH